MSLWVTVAIFVATHHNCGGSNLSLEMVTAPEKLRKLESQRLLLCIFSSPLKAASDVFKGDFMMMECNSLINCH